MDVISRYLVIFKKVIDNLKLRSIIANNKQFKATKKDNFYALGKEYRNGLYKRYEELAENFIRELSPRGGGWVFCVT